MIERKIITQRLEERRIEEFIFSFLGMLSCSTIKLQRTPLGEKISVYTSRPGLVVGRKGENIRALTNRLKSQFKMENPQIEVVEIENPDLDAATITRNLINTFGRFGPKRFKAIAYRVLENIMKAGARGAEIVISGRGIPGERSKTWRFVAGYLKKSGDISESYMDRSYENCNLKTGTIGIKVTILHPDVILPDDIKIKEEKPVIEIKEEVVEEGKKVEEKKGKKVKEKKESKDETKKE